jgi:hypothetical protein
LPHHREFSPDQARKTQQDHAEARSWSQGNTLPLRINDAG